MPINIAGLVEGTYVILTGRMNPGEYHWVIWTWDGGPTPWAFHLRDAPGGRYDYTKMAWHAPNSVMAIAGLKIGQPRSEAELDALLRPIPHVTPAIDQPAAFDCVIWWRQAIRAMHNAGYIYCPNVLALQAEATAVANRHADGVRYNHIPGGLYTSAYSR